MSPLHLNNTNYNFLAILIGLITLLAFLITLCSTSPATLSSSSSSSSSSSLSSSSHSSSSPHTSMIIESGNETKTPRRFPRTPPPPPAPKWRITEKIRRKIKTVQETLDCHERSFTFRAVQTDPITGLQCRDYIKLLSCWGRCNSGEISDYRFPYKRSFHNVCMHNLVERRLFELTDCDRGAPDYIRWYQTVVAKSCICRQCETSTANCESASMDMNYMK